MRISNVINDYERMFIANCKSLGMTPEQTGKALLDCPMRNTLLNLSASAESNESSVNIVVTKEGFAKFKAIDKWSGGILPEGDRPKFKMNRTKKVMDEIIFDNAKEVK